MACECSSECPQAFFRFNEKSSAQIAHPSPVETGGDTLLFVGVGFSIFGEGELLVEVSTETSEGLALTDGEGGAGEGVTEADSKGPAEHPVNINVLAVKPTKNFPILTFPRFVWLRRRGGV